MENNNIVNPPPCWEREYIREKAPSVRKCLGNEIKIYKLRSFYTEGKTSGTASLFVGSHRLNIEQSPCQAVHIFGEQSS